MMRYSYITLAYLARAVSARRTTDASMREASRFMGSSVFAAGKHHDHAWGTLFVIASPALVRTYSSKEGT